MVIAALGFVFLCYIGALTFSRSGLVTRFLERSLSQRTGLEWAIDGQSWNGLNRLQIDRVSISQPQGIEESRPMLTVRELRVTTALYKFRPVLKRLEITQPVGVVSLEMLGALAGGLNESASADTRPQVVPPDANAPAPDVPDAPTVPATDVPDEPTAPPAEQPEIPPRDLPPEVDLVVRGGSLTVVRDGVENAIAVIDGVEMTMPLIGADRRGYLAWEKGAFFPESERKWSPTQRKMAIQLINNEVVVDEVFNSPVGANVQVGIRARPSRSLPLRAEITLPEQAVEEMEIFGGRLTASAERVSARWRIGGALGVPQTMRMELALAADNLHVEDHGRDQTVHFYQSRIEADVTRSGARLRRLRMIGSELSLLGNATVNGAGDVAGLLRIYADGSAAGYLQEHLSGMPAFRSPKPWMARSETPERRRRDIRIKGDVKRMLADVGPDHEWVFVDDLIEQLQEFAKQEISEEQWRMDRADRLLPQSDR